MRKLMLVAGAVLLFFGSASAAQAQVATKAWNHSHFLRFQATTKASGTRPAGTRTFRISASSADHSANATTPGDPISWTLDGADADFRLESFFPTGAVLHEIGSKVGNTIVDPTNPFGPTWDATGTAYAQITATTWRACTWTYESEPTVADGQPSVILTYISGPTTADPTCTTYTP